MNKKQSVAVVFAGGKSSRMGTDKALLPFGKYPTLSEFQYFKLSALFHKVYLSTKEKKFDFTDALIFDCQRESSPLVGIVSVFEALNADEVFILSVDMPFVDKEIIRILQENNSQKWDAIVAKSPKGIQPLCGFYKKSILSLARNRLATGDHRLQSLLEEAQTHYVAFDSDIPFANLNTPDDYQNALEII
ncbi:MAG TPA: molybdenum cofactor guanylyltransferase [Sulfurovum sp. UBA12169]|nr:MAG TPA: molybdenum cofactor guanylyltransferase [Sulfurovum sp. UBA12169]